MINQRIPFTCLACESALFLFHTHLFCNQIAINWAITAQFKGNICQLNAKTFIFGLMAIKRELHVKMYYCSLHLPKQRDSKHSLNVLIYCHRETVFPFVNVYPLNILWPSHSIWWQRSGSTLALVMACCRLTAPNSTWNNLDSSSVNSTDSHPGSDLQETHRQSIIEISMKITCLECQSNFPGPMT